MTNLYAFSKAMHLIGVVSWFAGLFYLVRIMVYHAEAWAKDSEFGHEMAEQFHLMEGRVYKIIMTPAMVWTWAFGTIMLFVQPMWLQQPWMHVKLFLLVLLTGYHHYLKGHIKKLEANKGWPHTYYRVLNEVPTIFLAAIVFLAVFKTNINFLYWGLGLGVFILLIGFGIRKMIKKNQSK